MSTINNFIYLSNTDNLNTEEVLNKMLPQKTLEHIEKCDLTNINKATDLFILSLIHI